jgi:nitrous oxidase accessory protein NosD
MAFQTIQSAISAASPGDIINVAHATYNEDVVIDRAVSLIGQPDARNQNPFIVGSGGAGGIEAVVWVAPNVNNVFIQNFAIGDSEGTQQEQVGVLIDSGAGNVTLDHDVIRKVRDPDVSVPSPAATIGILVQPTAQNVSITHLALYQILDPPGSQGAVGIMVDGASQVTIDHTYVKHVGDVGFMIEGAASGVTLSADAVEETLSSSGTGIIVQDSAQVTLYHDKAYQLAGTSIGLQVSGSAQVTGTKDQLGENATGALITADFTGTFSLTNSNIYDNTQAGVDNLSSVLIDVTGDWWGDPSGPAPQGIGNAVLGPVDFSGWLDSPALSPA